MRVTTYIVRRGNTLVNISKAYGITLEELIVENPQIRNPNLIRVGEHILVPRSHDGPNPHVTLAEENIPLGLPLWHRIAMREEGVSEVPGAGNNPRILEYHSTTSLGRADARQDKTAWCSSFVNWCIEQTGRQGTDNAWARSWENWGRDIETSTIGSIAVFSRTNSTTNGGHVGFVAHETTSSVIVLGGNQGNTAKESTYPKSGRKGKYYYKLLSCRWPEDA